MKTISNYIPKKIPAEEQTDTISVVVPIYNIEKYLPKAIESILNQTYKNLEVILVDDGSTDGSLEICEQCAKRDSRIKVLHKSNGGAGSARNSGMELATGKYLTFVDGDDWIEKDMYEKMLSAIWETNSEIAVCRVKYVFSDKVVDGSTGTVSVFEDAELLETYIERNAGWSDGRFLIEHGAFNKLYIRSLAQGISFSADTCGEEIRFTTQLLSRIQKGIYLDTAYYHYVSDRPDSLMHSRGSFELFEKDLLTWYDKSTFLRKIGRSDLADVNDFFLCDYLLSAYLEWGGDMSRLEMKKLRNRIEKIIWENRLQIEKLYTLPVGNFKKRIQMRLFFMSPRLFVLVSKVIDIMRDVANRN